MSIFTFKQFVRLIRKPWLYNQTVV